MKRQKKHFMKKNKNREIIAQGDFFFWLNLVLCYIVCLFLHENHEKKTELLTFFHVSGIIHVIF